jgi:hypothetical protein
MASIVGSVNSGGGGGGEIDPEVLNGKADLTYVNTQLEVKVDKTNCAIGTREGQDIGAVAIGSEAGLISQKTRAVAVGTKAGKDNQGIFAVAIGDNAGEFTQGASAISIGNNSGTFTQGVRCVAVGDEAGETMQGTFAVAIGAKAGRLNQANNSIVINATGTDLNNTVANAVVVKPVRATEVNSHILSYNDTTGEISKSSVAQVETALTGKANLASPTFTGTVVLPSTTTYSGTNLQTTLNTKANLASPTFTGTVVLPSTTTYNGTNLQTVLNGKANVASPTFTGTVVLPETTTYNGTNLGTQLNLKANVTELNLKANLSLFTGSQVKIGAIAGQNLPGENTIAIGSTAATNGQGINAIAIGAEAAVNNQGTNAIAIGRNAAPSNQATNSIVLNATGAILNNTVANALVVKPVRETAVNSHILSYNDTTGEIVKSTPAQVETVLTGKVDTAKCRVSTLDSVAIQQNATTSQGQRAIAIGLDAGRNTQGTNSIAIGAYAGTTAQQNNSIIINATGNPLETTTTSSFYVKPIRAYAVSTDLLHYNPTSGEIGRSSLVDVISALIPLKSLHCLQYERNLAGGSIAGVYLSVGNGSPNGIGLAMPVSGRILRGTMFTSSFSGTNTIAVVINGTVNTSLQLSSTLQTTGDATAISNWTPVNFSAGDKLNFILMNDFTSSSNGAIQACLFVELNGI